MGDSFSPFLFDAVLLYAIAVNETLMAGRNPRNGEAVARNMRGKVFRGNCVGSRGGPGDGDICVRIPEQEHTAHWCSADFRSTSVSAKTILAKTETGQMTQIENDPQKSGKMRA